MSMDYRVKQLAMQRVAALATNMMESYKQNFESVGDRLHPTIAEREFDMVNTTLITLQQDVERLTELMRDVNREVLPKEIKQYMMDQQLVDIEGNFIEVVIDG